MVNHCANEGCGKPLHYLRDGRIYVFDCAARNTIASQKRERRLEHYWLCGTCVQKLILVQDAQGWIHVAPRPEAIIEGEIQPVARSERAS